MLILHQIIFYVSEKNLSETIKKLIIKVYDTIINDTLNQDMNREAAKISGFYSGKN